MTFNSYIFILLFFPAVLISYYWCLRRKKNTANLVLLAASGIFYCYADYRAAFLFAIDILLNYGVFRCMTACRKRNRVLKERYILWIGIGCNLLILAYFKYYNFFVDNFNLLFGSKLSIKEILLPMGISFITFQQIAFLVDAGRNEIPSCSLTDYALFVSFFPHIGAGPIVLHGEFLPLLKKERRMDWDRFAQGLFMFAMGLGKKVLIADVLGSAVDWGYSDPTVLNRTSALFVSFAYTLQIYFDFSGYSDMAIGISRMLLLDLPINFNSPYRADNIVEFWKRWHMTLTGFLTKYLYIPLGGSRKGKLRTCVNTLIVFLCSGLWHGAGWTFLLWGGMHGCLMILTKQFHRFFDKLPKAIGQCVTLIFLNFTWVVFRAGSFTVLRQIISSMLHNEWGELSGEMCDCFMPVVLENSGCPSQVCAILFTAAAAIIVLKCKNVQERAEHMKYSVKSCAWALGVMLLSVFSLSGVSAFVYSLF